MTAYSPARTPSLVPDKICKRSSDILDGNVPTAPEQASHPRGPTTLSSREQMVFNALCRGIGAKAIAEELSLSRKTVSTYKARIIEKMGFRSTSAFMEYLIGRAGPVPAIDPIIAHLSRQLLQAARNAGCSAIIVIEKA